LTPEIVLSNNTLNGISSVDISIQIAETANCDTSDDIIVYMNKDAKLNLSWDPNLDLINGLSLNNIDWNFINSNPDYYIWTSTNSILANSTQNIGFVATLDPAAVDGSMTLTVNLAKEVNGVNQVFDSSHSLSINFAH